MNPLSFWLLLLCGTAFPAPVNAADIAGRVVRVSDGDTITLDTGSARVVVRLQDIDAPEGDQDYGQESRASLNAMCPVGTPASGPIKEHDRYGRPVVRLNCTGGDASLEQVRAGAAWVSVRYAPKDSPLYPVEAEARAARRGLWIAPSPTPPWVYRKDRLSR